jgi:hypothetical protein
MARGARGAAREVGLTLMTGGTHRAGTIVGNILASAWDNRLFLVEVGVGQSAADEEHA